MEENSYLPLFRKYRPQSFKDVIGQDFTVRALENAIKLNKVANAYLFCGPRGTGKTSSARIFAKSLNCKEGPAIEPCQKCQSCLDVTNASGLDVIEIDAATNRGIDDAKELISKVQYAPMNGRYKIFIIDEVHMLSKEAFNALLKTFEEPPKNVIFILATTEPHKVIETIVSRCQRFDFRRITIEDIVKRLREISDIEKINITDEALFSIAKNVSGGMRDSLALLDQASILGIDNQITKETIESLIGKLTFDVLYNLLENILSKEIENSVNLVEKIYENGSEPRNFAENFIEFLRNIILISNSKDENVIRDLTLFDKENIEKIKLNPLFSKEKLILILDKAVEFYKEIKVAANPYLWAELMVITSASLDVSADIDMQIRAEIKTADDKISSEKLEKLDIKTPAATPIAPVQKKPDVLCTDTASNDGTSSSSAPSDIMPSNCAQPAPFTAKDPISSGGAPLKNISPAAPNSPPSDTLSSNSPASSTPAVSSGNSPADIWINIINKIESIPAKFFYSGVGKLINITSGQITLGFVNQNAIVQAKSANKFNPLMKAITAVLGENGSIEFVTVSADTKIIETKLNVKIQQETQPKPQYRPSKYQSSSEREYQKNEKENSAAHENKTAEAKTDTSNYTPATREMLETFNGRIVED